MKKYCNDNKTRTRCASLEIMGDERKTYSYCLAYKKELKYFHATKLTLACDECQKNQRTGTQSLTASCLDCVKTSLFLKKES